MLPVVQYLKMFSVVYNEISLDLVTPSWPEVEIVPKTLSAICLGAAESKFTLPALPSPHNTLRSQGLLGCQGKACMAVLFSLPIQVTMRCQSSSTRSTSPIALSWCLWLLRLVTPAALLFLVFR